MTPVDETLMLTVIFQLFWPDPGSVREMSKELERWLAGTRGMQLDSYLYRTAMAWRQLYFYNLSPILKGL